MAIGTGRDGTGTDAGPTFEPLPIIGSERRLHVRAFHYWRARADGRPMPRLEDCADLSEAGFARQMILIDLAKGDRPARIRAVGRDLVEEVPNAEIPAGSLIDELLVRLPTVALQRAPVGFEAEAPAGEDLGRCFRGILLPIAGDDDAIAHVLGVISWRQVAAEHPGREIMAAVASLPTAPRAADGGSPWSADPVTRRLPAAATPEERLASARTWKALAGMDRTRSRTHFHAAIGAAYDAVADLPTDETAGTLLSVFDDAPELPLIEQAIEHARLLAIGGHELASWLDGLPGGLAEFIAQQDAALEPEAEPTRMRFRLSSLDADLLAPAPRRDKDSRTLPKRRASR
ncbi:hypothetical protein HL653_17880 [Sphingomonas sp. AP4-R1]|uniref:hypothetical protein n=1 Tax=Sphingomonas sp. AP4-R1 TaxID=2735134 RepID=UPI001493C9A6|nr:hypothetical protein [Sphingomonas sp. AP4-R1]QJU59376.1 hypothetical protein HL653_17880 [Sphingomonas sp. AP4-R1]